MNETNLADLETLFLALSDATRIKLISLMSDGEVSVGYLAESAGESQPKVSRHLAYLRSAGLVATRRDGKHVYYGIEWPSDKTAANVLSAVLGSGSGEHVDNKVEMGCVDHAYQIADELTSAKTYVNDYTPEEIEIYLL